MKQKLLELAGKFKIRWYTYRRFAFYQLLMRVYIQVKRMFISRTPGMAKFSKGRLENRITLDVAALELKQLFPLRSKKLILHDDILSVYLLNQEQKIGDIRPVPDLAWFPVPAKPETQLWLMNLHYHEYIEALDFDDAILVIQHWIRNCEPYQGRYWYCSWNSYVVSIRVVVWMQMLSNSEKFSHHADRAEILLSLYKQLRYLRGNLESDLGGNHLLKNIKALLIGGSFFMSQESAEWFEFAQNALLVQLEKQINADGMHFELSPTYHNQVFADLLECFSVLDKNNELGNELGQVLDRMAVVTRLMKFNCGNVSLLGDGGLNSAYSPTACLTAYNNVRDPAISLEPCGAFSLVDSGYYGFTDEREVLLVDCAEVGALNLPAHGHGDALAFEYEYGNISLFIDTGVFEYIAGSMRDYSKATSSHNTLCLDGHDQSEFWSSFRVARSASIRNIEFKKSEFGFSLSAEQTGYTRLHGAPVHRRVIEFETGNLFVEDRVLDGSGQLAESSLLLNPDCEVEQINETRLYLTIAENKFELTSSADMRIDSAFWFPDLGQSLDTRKIVIKYGLAPCSGWFRLKYLT